MDCIVLTKDTNASLDVYVFVALLQCAETTAACSERWELQQRGEENLADFGSYRITE